MKRLFLLAVLLALLAPLTHANQGRVITPSDWDYSIVEFIRGIQIFTADSIGTPEQQVETRLQIREDKALAIVKEKQLGHSTVKLENDVQVLDAGITASLGRVKPEFAFKVNALLTKHAQDLQQAKQESPDQSTSIQQLITAIPTPVQLPIPSPPSSSTVNWNALTEERATQECQAHVDAKCSCRLVSKDLEKAEFTCSNGIISGAGTCWNAANLCEVNVLGITRIFAITDYIK